MREIPGLVDLDSTLKPDKPTVAIEVKRDAAADAGLNVNALAGTLRTLVAGTTVGNWRAPDGENYDVNVRLTPAGRDALGDLQRLPITVAAAADGSPRVVRLSQVPTSRPPPGRTRSTAATSTARSTSTPMRWAAVRATCRPISRSFSTASPGRRATATCSAARRRT